MKFEKERKSSIWPRQKGFVCVFQILTELPASLCFSINKQTIAFHPHRTPKRNPPTSTSSKKKKKMHTQIYTLDITMGLKGGTFAGIYMKHVWKFSVKAKIYFMHCRLWLRVLVLVLVFGSASGLVQEKK